MIKGDKVLLRAIEPGDVRRLWEWRQDEETMRFRDYPAPPISLDEAEREYRESGGNPSRLNLAITTEEGELIGETSLTNIDRRVGTAIFVIAIGNKSYWGRGYGSDATRTLMRYAFEQENLHRVTLFVHAFNTRAIRAYEKVGFRHEGCMRDAQYMDGRYSDVLIMGLLRQDLVLEDAARSSEETARKV